MMTNSSKKIFPIPLGINWHEGMLLSQHQFQQNDLRHFHILANQLRLLSSNHFGVCHLRIDTVALPDGVYRINEIQAVFPDGLIHSYFSDERIKLKPLEINISSNMKDGESEVTIYLAIAEIVDGASQVVGKHQRFYSVDGASVKDENIQDNEVKIPRLVPNVFLHIGDQLPNLCTGFPLCKILRIDGVYQVKNWTPPCFFILKHFPMFERCLKLALNIREKATFLSEKLKNQSGSANATTGTEQILKQLLMILPKFEALIYSDHIRPYSLYEALAEILGSVAVIRPTDMIPVMHPYDHNDIDSCIYPLIQLIEYYISTIERGFVTIPLNKKDRFFYHYLSLNDLESCKDNKIYIGIKGVHRNAYNDVETWMNDAIIVSDHALEDVRERRVKGAVRSIVKDDMISKIMPGSGVMLFEVSTDSSFVKPEQNIHIFNPGDNLNIRPTEITMYIPREKQKLM